MKSVKMRPNILLDSFVVMPNHLHGIVVIDGCEEVEEIRKTKRAFAIRPYERSPSHTINAIIRCFKAAVTRRIHRTYANSKQKYMGA